MELQRDCNVTINVDGVLTYWQGATPSGGEPIEYPATPVGGRPAFNTCDDVYNPHEWSLESFVPGADQTARDAFIAKFDKGKVFTVANPPTSSGDMFITGESAPVGTPYEVMSRPVVHGFQENSKITITLKENNAHRQSSAGTGTGSGT